MDIRKYFGSAGSSAKKVTSAPSKPKELIPTKSDNSKSNKSTKDHIILEKNNNIDKQGKPEKKLNVRNHSIEECVNENVSGGKKLAATTPDQVKKTGKHNDKSSRADENSTSKSSHREKDVDNKKETSKKKTEKKQSEEIGKASGKKRRYSSDSDEDFDIKKIKTSSKQMDNSKEQDKKSVSKKEKAKMSVSKNDKEKSMEKKKEKLNKSHEEPGKEKLASKEKSATSGNEEVMYVDSDVDSDSPPLRKTSKKKDKKKNIKVSSEEEKEESDDDVSRRIMKKGRKKKKKYSCRISDSDSEADVKVKKPREKKPKKRQPMFCESDDETKISSIKDFFKLHNKVENSTSSKNAKSPTKAVAMSCADFFGSSIVERTERKATIKKKDKVEDESFENEFHDDDDFLATLAQLDEETLVNKKAKVETPKKKTVTPQKCTSSCSVTPKKSVTPSKVTPEKVTPEKRVTSRQGTPEIKVTPERTSKQLTPSKSATSSSSPGNSLTSKLAAKIKQIEEPIRSSPKTPTKTITTTPSEKPKVNIPETPTPNSAGKRTSYRSFLNREGPQNLGSKEIPEGAENCLEGLTFVITGILDSIERDEAKSLIERYGGRVTVALSRKTNYLIVGREPGQTKLEKAGNLKTSKIDEDGLLDLIRSKPGKKSKFLINAEESVKKEKLEAKKNEKKSNVSDVKPSVKSQLKASCVPSTSDSTKDTKPDTTSISQTPSDTSLLWVDKYKPNTLKQIIGQNGDKSNAKKLLNWISKWHANRAAGVKPRPNRFFGGSDNGAGMKAALLSGPPGIGKTTTAHVVCKEAGFSVVEMNASDTRNKSSLTGELSTLLNNTSLVDYCGTESSSSNGFKHCVIMDEVDGMAGNEDRGGVAELIQLVKTSKIPIICICNDRQHQKIRSLANHCFDLRFQRPHIAQIKSAMMTIAYKEGLKIIPGALNEIISASNHDIRQIIHNLFMWSSSDKNISYEDAKSNAEMAKKDIKLNPFDVCRQVFAGGQKKMSFIDKSDLFFHNYQIAPLFVHENYASVQPFAGRGNTAKHLSLLARAANSICDGDIVEKLIHQRQNWTLLPIEAVYASVLPGEYMRGSVNYMISFPSWLGKYSSQNKNQRILQELGGHMKLNISADLRGLNLDYLPCLQQHLVKPLQEQEKEGVPEVIALMDKYDLLRDDYDNIMDITKWPNSKDYTKSLTTSTKAAFTRSYNKESHMTPYTTGTVSKKRAKAGSTGDNIYVDESQIDQTSDREDDSDDDDVTKDSMIKKKSNKSSEKKTNDIKGKGKGKKQSKISL